MSQDGKFTKTLTATEQEVVPPHQLSAEDEVTLYLRNNDADAGDTAIFRVYVSPDGAAAGAGPDSQAKYQLLKRNATTGLAEVQDTQGGGGGDISVPGAATRILRLPMKGYVTVRGVRGVNDVEVEAWIAQAQPGA